jgi:hypothetical protein
MVGLTASRGHICGDDVDVCAAPRFEQHPFVRRIFYVIPSLALKILN